MNLKALEADPDRFVTDPDPPFYLDPDPTFRLDSDPKLDPDLEC